MSDLKLEDDDGVLVLPVRVIPGASRNKVRDVYRGALRVAVSAPPADGEANKALVRFLADQLCIRRSQLEIASGRASRDKKIHIAPAAAATARESLERILSVQ